MKVTIMTEKEMDIREPVTELIDTAERVLLVAELPGVSQDAIKIAVSKDILKLKAEGARGRFGTIQVLPFEPDQDTIAVTFSQGVLEVSLKRKPDDIVHEGEKNIPIPTTVDTSLKDMGKELDTLREELARVSGERASLEERVNFLQKDFLNLRRRHENEKELIADRKIESLAAGLVEVLDSFGLAKESISRAGNGKGNMESFLKGVEMIENQVLDLFQRTGIARMVSVGQPFDPNFHEAVGYVERNDLDDDVIAQEIKCGYIYKDRALRPAQVIVNRKPEKGKKKRK